MLRIHGSRDTLLAALLVHWADQQLELPPALRPTPKRSERKGGRTPGRG